MDLYLLKVLQLLTVLRYILPIYLPAQVVLKVEMLPFLDVMNSVKRESVKDLVDVQELTVFGPRRSFGLLRFKPRQDEQYSQVRERMWKTIQVLRETYGRLLIVLRVDLVRIVRCGRNSPKQERPGGEVHTALC
ncbi:unnamed protein product [Symbiodinium sp. CCMP2456]|nr:unnamed protein product [Symbiodinium sp. CCMP2456]